MEWAVMDMALQIVAAVNVSLYATLPPGQCSYYPERFRFLSCFFVSTGIQLKKAVEIFDECKDLKQVVGI